MSEIGNYIAIHKVPALPHQLTQHDKLWLLRMAHVKEVPAM